MSGVRDAEDGAVKAMRLRADPPKPLRLSRKMAMAGVATLGVAIAAALGVGLLQRDADGPAEELTRSAAPPPEAVRALPGDYAVPRLGPPLPGNLGGPILEAHNAAEAGEGTSEADLARETREADQRLAELERLRAERDAARTSALLVLQTSGPQAAQAGSPLAASASAPSAAGDGVTPTGDRLMAGAILEASLITGIRSDLPGQVLGQITADVHDTLTGRRLLIPRGSRLIGAHDGQVSQGQSRLQIIWTRVILPNGRSVRLQNQTASDPQGFGGLEDGVDRRWGERFRSAALSTLVALSTAAVDVDADDRAGRSIRDGATRGVDTLGRGLVEQGLSLPPRLTIRPGYALRIILTEDLILPPYGD